MGAITRNSGKRKRRTYEITLLKNRGNRGGMLSRALFDSKEPHGKRGKEGRPLQQGGGKRVFASALLLPKNSKKSKTPLPTS